MNELIVGIILAAFSAAAWLAYMHPRDFRLLAQTVGKIFLGLFFSLLLFQFMGYWYVFCSGVEKEVATKINEAVITRLSPYSKWGLIIMFSATAYGFFLYGFVSRLKEKESLTRR
jgi:hypothetical protein